MRSLSVLFALTLLHPSLPATAFELDGYRSRMSFVEVTDVARRSGWDIVSISFLGSSGNGTYIQRRQRPSGEIEFGRDFSFCNGHLMSSTENVQGDFDAFARTVEAFTERFGKGSITARSELGQNGTSSSVTIEWFDQNSDRHRVSMSTFQGRGTVYVSVFSPQVATSCHPTN
jgi:hypothetical protein